MKLLLAFLSGILTVTCYSCVGSSKWDKPRTQYGVTYDSANQRNVGWFTVTALRHRDDVGQQAIGGRATVFAYGKDSLICIGYDITDTLGILRALEESNSLGDSAFHRRLDPAFCIDYRKLVPWKKAAVDTSTRDTIYFNPPGN